MIISPPFLPARGSNNTEQEWLDVAMAPPPSRMPDTRAPEGAFPLSHNLSWHNGIHIQAPQAYGAYLPVRAIGDGKIVFVGKPTASNSNVNAPQNYNPFDRPGIKTAAWTDNGCIIIEHSTTIGANGATETSVVFYSLYMHLSALAKNASTQQTWKVNDVILRKAEVGTPGQIYGHGGQIHFEVCINDSNLQQLIGRAANWVAPNATPRPTADGRIDSIFGSIYFYLPASSHINTNPTRPNSSTRQANGATLGTPLWVKMTYNQGTCIFESFDEAGNPIGTPLSTPDDEYNLYDEATTRHNLLDAAHQANSSPSGWYELLRFGRNIGRGLAATDKDSLPSDATHWRRIVGPGGSQLWVDLNAEGSFKFSDADFLPVMGWNCIEDDSNPNDQRCDSVNLKSLICDTDPNNTHRMDVSNLAGRLGDAAVQKKVKKAICKFPSEWDQSTIDSRYAFVMDFDSFKKNPQGWASLESHIKAISFSELPSCYLTASWHIHPREFIEHMRMCGWRSSKEICQTFPRHLFYTTSGVRTAITSPASTYSLSQATALSRIQNHAIDLNRVMRKYGLVTAKRQSHFLAQTMLETAQWRNIPPNKLLMNEWGFGEYSPSNPMTQYYSAFYGRGVLQLTWVGNYRDYGKYRGSSALQNNTGAYIERLTPNHPRITKTSQHWTGNPADGATQITWGPRYDPDIIATNPYNACDSGGFYWVSKHHSGTININRVCDQDFTPATVGRVSVLVNGGGNGYYERQAYAAYNYRHLSDSVESTTESIINSPPPKAQVRANFSKPT